jgi:hypothetical protein
MAKINTGIAIDEKVYEQAKALADLDSRSFSSFVEIALKQVIERFYRQTQLPGLAPEATPEIEKI